MNRLLLFVGITVFAGTQITIAMDTLRPPQSKFGHMHKTRTESPGLSSIIIPERDDEDVDTIPIPNLSVHQPEFCSALSTDKIDALARTYDPKTFRAKLDKSLHCDLLYCGIDEKDPHLYAHSARHAAMLIDHYHANPNQLIPWGRKEIPLIYERVYCLQLNAIKFLINHGARFDENAIIKFALQEVPIDVESCRLYSVGCPGCQVQGALSGAHNAECDDWAKEIALDKQKKLASIITYLMEVAEKRVFGKKLVTIDQP